MKRPDCEFPTETAWVQRDSAASLQVTLLLGNSCSLHLPAQLCTYLSEACAFVTKIANVLMYRQRDEMTRYNDACLMLFGSLFCCRNSPDPSSRSAGFQFQKCIICLRYRYNVLHLKVTSKSMGQPIGLRSGCEHPWQVTFTAEANPKTAFMSWLMFVVS